MLDSLLAQIVASPDDPAAYLVLADWLATQDDERSRAHASLIVAAIQHPEDTELLARLAAPVLPFVPGEYERVRWKHGFIRAASLIDRDSAPIVDALLALPAARLLDDLYACNTSGADLQRTIASLALVRPAALRELGIEEQFPDGDGYVEGIALGDVSPLWSLPLAKLALRASTATFGAIDAPTLERFAWEGGLDAAAIAALGAARWPRLTKLSITFGRYFYGTDDVPAVFDGDALCRAIATSAWGDQLTQLDLEECAMTDAVAQMVLDRFPTLSLRISNSPIGAFVRRQNR
jgi:uncharacterized protein (TIGR02996 family)